LSSCSRIWFMQIGGLVASQYGHKVMQNHKMRRTFANRKSTGLKLARVDVRQELHLMIVVMMSPWQQTLYQTSTFPKWIMPYLLLQRLTDFLVHVLCNDHIRFALSEWKSKENNSSWKGNSHFTLLMFRAWSPLCCHGNVTKDKPWNLWWV